jgi:hypoxanthine phosphoribosyltransferase
LALPAQADTSANATTPKRGFIGIFIVSDNPEGRQVPGFSADSGWRFTGSGDSGTVGAMPPREIIPAAAIARRVTELGAEIDARLPAGPLTVVGVLRGAFMFMADLVRAIPREITCDFLGVRSYGDATVSSGVVEITSDLAAPIAGQRVLLVEDIVDTGLTLKYLVELLQARGPASVHTCALMAKPHYRATGVPALDFVGFDAPDAFVVGYGMDRAQLYRNLPFVAALDPEAG